MRAVGTRLTLTHLCTQPRRRLWTLTRTAVWSGRAGRDRPGLLMAHPRIRPRVECPSSVFTMSTVAVEANTPPPETKKAKKKKKKRKAKQPPSPSSEVADQGETLLAGPDLIMANQSKEAKLSEKFSTLTPMLALNEIYLQQKLGQAKEFMVFESVKVGKQRNIHWAAVLSCPLSKQVVRSGRVRTNRIYVVLPDQRVVYPRKLAAQAAAAARVLDWWRAEELGQLEPRLCDEDPLDLSSLIPVEVLAAEDVSDQSDENELDSLSEEEEKADDSETTSTDGDESSLALSTRESGKVISNDPFTKKYEQGDDDEDVFIFGEMEADASRDRIIKDEPSTDSEESFILRTPPVHSSRVTPAQSLLQTISSQAATVASTTSSTRAVSSSGVSAPPEEKAKRTLKIVDSWVRAKHNMRKVSTKTNVDNLHRVLLKKNPEENLLSEAKSVLRILVDAQNDIEDTKQIVGFESAALEIMKLLWGSEEVQPDADCYALYIGCLDGPDGMSVAYKAEKIVQEMMDEQVVHGFAVKHPLPNANVHNALLRMFVRCGGLSEETERILSNFAPNNETFWTLLTAPAYRRDFSQHVSKEYDLQNVQKYLKELLLQPGTDGELPFREVDLLNAPLRWSGGSRPNTGRQAWPTYKEVNENGFQAYKESSPAVQNAKAVHEWVEKNPYIDSNHADITSYECVIQAWTRTGTHQGARIAEKIMEELLLEPIDSPRYPRLSTFHPILSSWFQHEAFKSGERLKYWTDKVFFAAKSSSEMEPDARIYELAITSRWQIICNMCNDGLQDEAIELAEECTELLREFCATTFQSKMQAEGPNFVSIWKPFVLTMRTWGKILLATNGRSRDEYLLKALSGTRQPVELFEEVVKNLYEQDKASGLYRNGQLSPTLFDVLGDSKYVYSMYAYTLEHKFVPKQLEHWNYLKLWKHLNKHLNLKREIVNPLLLDVERHVRSFAEIKSLVSAHFEWKYTQEKFIQPDTANIFTDHFDYAHESKTVPVAVMNITTSPRYLWLVCFFLQKIVKTSLFQVGDLVRLCRVLSRAGQSWSFRTDVFERCVAEILDKAVPSSPHRDALIESIRQTASEEGNTAKGKRKKKINRNVSEAGKRVKAKRKHNAKESEKRIKAKKKDRRKARQSRGRTG